MPASRKMAVTQCPAVQFSNVKSCGHSSFILVCRRGRPSYAVLEGQLTTMPEVLTLCQNALNTISQDDGSPLNVHAVEEVGCLNCRHPLTTGTLHEIHYLQGMVSTHQSACTYNLGGVKKEGGTFINPTQSPWNHVVCELMQMQKIGFYTNF